MKTTNVETKTRNKVSAVDTSQATVELSRGATIAAVTVPALIGIWGLACFVGGMVASGGPLAMVKNYFSAVTGM